MRMAILSTMAAGALLASASVSLGIQYVDNNPADVWLGPGHSSYNGQFNLIGYGYNPATEKIDSAVATFCLGDLLGSETYLIKVEGLTFASGNSFFGFITVGGGVTGTLLGILDDTGILDYTVKRTSGEFWLLNANLTAQASDRQNGPPPAVPDGGTTLTLLGLSLLGIGGLYRKVLAH